MENERVVIEYDFQGYSAPEGAEADFLPCTVIHKPVELGLLGDDLAEVRDNLFFEGYEMVEVTPTKTRQFGKCFPRWREVWAKVEQPLCECSEVECGDCRWDW